MAQEVQIPEELFEQVRQEANLQGRSVADQLAHWIELGRAVDLSPGFDYSKVSTALEGKLDTAELTKLEDAVWVELFTERMDKATDKEKAFFARRRHLGLGAGLDAFGKLTYAGDG